MSNIPECFNGVKVTGVCTGNGLENCENCVYRVDLVVGDAGGYRDFFSGLKTMSGIGVVDTRQQNILTI